jgi:hypothetical protein
MTLEELYTKWRIGSCEVDAIIANHPNKIVVKMPSFDHSAPLGDFIKDYIDHCSISWWRKAWDWKLVELGMRKILNQIHIRFVGRF